MDKAATLNNPLLAATEERIESQLTPATQQDYLKVVVSGMKVALEKGPDGILAGLLKSKDPVNDSVVGAINLCLLLRRQSRNTMPLKALVPAAMTLMLKALDFAEQNGMLKVDEPTLVKASHLFTDTVFKQFGITNNMLNTAAAKVKQIASDPGQLERVKRAAGVVKDPNASQPTLPEEAA